MHASSLTSGGFSEHHPVDKVGRDNYRSQANRRVEVLFFDEGEEPDLEILKEAPELTELYLPGAFRWEKIPPRLGGAKRTLDVFIRFMDSEGKPMPHTEYELTQGGAVRTGVTGNDAVIRELCLPLAKACAIRWKVDPDEDEIERNVLYIETVPEEEVLTTMLSNLGYIEGRNEVRFDTFAIDVTASESSDTERKLLPAKAHQEGRLPDTYSAS